MEIRDSRNTYLGKTSQISENKIEMRDSRNTLVGTYDSKSDETRDARGTYIGKGNQLGSLLPR